MLTRPDAPSGRGRQLRPSPVAEHAAAHGIEVLTPPTPSDPEFLERLRAIEPGLLPDRGLRRPAAPRGARHARVRLDQPALLGAARLARCRARAAGDHGRRRGHRRHRVQPGRGARRRARCSARSPSASATTTPPERCSTGWPDEGAGLLVDALDHIEDGDIARPSAAGGRRLLRGQAHHGRRPRRLEPARRSRSTGRSADARPSPVPGRCSGTSGSSSGRPASPRSPTLEPGRLDIGKREVRVGTATTDVVLGDVQPFGRKRMPAADWARGATFPGVPEFS